MLINLAPLTQKYNDKLHEKMLAKCEGYWCGYEYGCGSRRRFERLTIDELLLVYRVYTNQRTYFAAGLARVYMELIREKTKKAVA